MENDTRKKVLYIDDDVILLELVKAFLKDDFLIITVNSGRDALGLLGQGIVPDIILLDILMPEMDGWETFNKIREISLLNIVPILFLSSVTDEEYKQRASLIGAADYITKPLQKEFLLQRIKAAIDAYEKKRLFINQQPRPEG